MSASVIDQTKIYHLNGKNDFDAWCIAKTVLSINVKVSLVDVSGRRRYKESTRFKSQFPPEC
ncbi:hypothetical protein J6590_104494, partial [Homalodisca vitripennis]